MGAGDSRDSLLVGRLASVLRLLGSVQRGVEGKPGVPGPLGAPEVRLGPTSHTPRLEACSGLGVLQWEEDWGQALFVLPLAREDRQNHPLENRVILPVLITKSASHLLFLSISPVLSSS